MTLPANGSWVSTYLANGSYTFAIPNVADYVPSLRDGALTVAGGNLEIRLLFQRAAFEVTFQVLGASPSTSWQVRLANATVRVLASATEFAEPNGTYTFDVQAPAGYYADPSHGNLTILGGALTVHETFSPVGIPLSDPWVPAVVIGAAISFTAAAVYLVGRRQPGRREEGP